MASAAPAAGTQNLSGQEPVASEQPAAPEWGDVAARLPELVAVTPPGLQRFDGAASAADWAHTARICAALHRDGAVILERAVSEETCDAVIAEMMPYIDDAGFGDAFLGGATRRASAVVSRSTASHAMIQHPMFLRLLAGVVGQQVLHLDREEFSEWLVPGARTLPVQLSLSQVICIGPATNTEEMSNGLPQVLHRDGQGFIMDMQQRVEPEISSVWALVDFTAENGATRVCPGSHRYRARGEGRRRPTDDEAEQAIMPKGSVVLYLGDCYHSGGANLSDELRWGLNVNYNLAHYRQEENQFLACPPHVARTLSPELQALVGYTMPGTSLGYFAEYQHPKDALDTSARPVDWAHSRPKL